MIFSVGDRVEVKTRRASKLNPYTKAIGVVIRVTEKAVMVRMNSLKGSNITKWCNREALVKV